MARARLIKPGLFKNEDLSDCPFEARLLFIGLWTIADREGFVEYRPKRIKAELFPYDEVDVPFLVMKLHGKKFLAIVSFENSLFIHVLGFKAHQNPHPKESPSDVDANLMRVLTCEEVVKLHGEPCKETARNAFNPISLLSFNPSILQSCVPVEASSTGPTLTDGKPASDKPKAEPTKRFVAPTLEEVTAEIQAKGYQIDPQYFIDFYEAQDWKFSGGLKMKSWTKTLSRWHRHSGDRKPKSSNHTTSSQNALERTPEALEATYQKMFGDLPYDAA